MQQAHATAGISREVTSGSHHVASPLATRSSLSIPVFTSRSDYDVVCYLRTKDRIALSRFFSSFSFLSFYRGTYPLSKVFVLVLSLRSLLGCRFLVENLQGRCK